MFHHLQIFLFYSDASLNVPTYQLQVRVFCLLQRRTIPETQGKELCQPSTPGHRPPMVSLKYLSGYTGGMSRDFQNSTEADAFMRLQTKINQNTNYLRLNEDLIKDDSEFYLKYYWFPKILFFLDIQNLFLFFLKLSVTHNNLVDYTFINRNEIWGLSWWSDG